jgi:hypothetical protein
MRIDWPGSLELTRLETAMVITACIFFASGLMLVIALFVSRVWKSKQKAKAERIRIRFRSIINDLIVTEGLSDRHNPEAAVDFRLEQLDKLSQTGFLRQELLNQLLQIRRNISGNSVKTLEMIYNRLKLYSVSLKKFRNFSSYTKATGVRELSAMQHKEAGSKILQFKNTGNQTLREEAILASLFLRPDDPLAFLIDYKYDISVWMKIHLHHYLQKLDARKLPDFSKWFGHDNITVVLFCVSMVRAFRQTDSLVQLVRLLHYSDSRVVSLTVETLGALDAYEYADNVAGLAWIHMANEKLSKRIVHCLGKIGSEDQHRPLLFDYAQHSSYEVRFEAIRSLILLGCMREIIVDRSGQRREETMRIINHLSEPLLN